MPDKLKATLRDQATLREMNTACEDAPHGTGLKVLRTVQGDLLLFALIWCSKHKLQSVTWSLARFCLLTKACPPDKLVQCVGQTGLHDNDTRLAWTPQLYLSRPVYLECRYRLCRVSLHLDAQHVRHYYVMTPFDKFVAFQYSCLWKV